jgi:DNA-binding LacI/PurR family transcriptional regulator
LPEFGYREFQRLWSLPQKPEGLIVFPDMVAAGATIAALELGVSAVTSQMKFVFHRNAGVRFLCPLSVTWAISDEALLAKGLIRMIERQFAGEKITPENLPFRFKEGTHLVLTQKGD